jgi:hypothetical protein
MVLHQIYDPFKNLKASGIILCWKRFWHSVLQWNLLENAIGVSLGT